MNIGKEFYRIISNTLCGLRLKIERPDDAQQGQDIIKKSIDEWYFIAIKYGLVDDCGKYIAPKNETDMIFNYLGVSSEKWIEKIDGYYRNQINSFINYDELVSKLSATQYTITQEGREFSVLSTEYNLDQEQKDFFKKIKVLDSEIYIWVRKFVIEHPIAKIYEIEHMREILTKSELNPTSIEKIIESCYEHIPSHSGYKCPYCGWTARRNKDGSYTCSHTRCNQIMKKEIPKVIPNLNFTYRVKPGINRYIVIPGLLELQIKKACGERNINCQLWPEKDKYDCLIKIPNRRDIRIDAKDYFNPYTLSYKLEDNTNFSDERCHNYIVVPNDAGRNKEDFCQVVNNRLPNHISCIKINDLFKKIEEK